MSNKDRLFKHDRLVRRIKRVILLLKCNIIIVYRKLIIKKLKEDTTKNSILLTHLGGGTQKYDEEHYLNHVTIQVTHYWKKIYSLSFFDKNEKKRNLYIKQRDLYNLIDGKYKEVVVGSLFGYHQSDELMKLLIKHKHFYHNDLIVLLHDYHSVCPTIFLIKNGFYCYLKCDNCNLVAPNELLSHRTNWGKLYECADKVVCFSKSSKEILLQVYENIDNKIIVQPHTVQQFLKHDTRHENGAANIGVVGNIYAEAKGLNVLRQIIPRLERSIQWSFIGNIKEEIEIDQDNVHYYGQYLLVELPEIVNAVGINCFVFPSVCPETFSYVISEITQFGMPIIAFRVGAQAEKLKDYPKAVLVNNIQEMIEAIQEFKMQHYLNIIEK